MWSTTISARKEFCTSTRRSSSPAIHTPWGAAINFDGPDSRVVRDFFIHNALYWLEEFHVDGLRLDAVHAIHDDRIPTSSPSLPARSSAVPAASATFIWCWRTT